VLRVRYAYDDAGRKMSVSVRQRSEPDSAYLYDLRLKAAIIYEGQPARIEDWHINRREQRYTFSADADGRYPLVIVDAEHVLPGRIDEEKPMEMWRRQLQAAPDYVSKLLAVDAAMRNDGQSLSPSVLSDALRDTIQSIRLYTLRRLASLKRQSSRDVLLPQVKLAAQMAGNKQRAAAFSVLGAWKDKSELPAMIAAVSDSSYLVSGSALGALAALAPDTAYTLARAALLRKPKSLLEASAWAAVAAKGKPEDFQLFRQNVLRVYGREKIALAGNIAAYALSVKDDSLFTQSLTLIDSMAQRESIRSYRYAIGSEVFNAAKHYKEEKNDTRYRLAEVIARDILAAEQDADNRSKYRKLAAF
jgi:hypothetical protein